jgi:ADP-ribose pyrophosphatase
MSSAKVNRKKKTLGAGKRLRLVSENGWEYVERIKSSGVVAIVAVTAANEILLTEQFRRSVAGRVLDLPAGLVGDLADSPDEELATAARRELIEETGYDARKFEFLSQSPTSPGLTSETVAFFRATGLKRVGAGGGVDDEQIQVYTVKLTAADAWLRKRARSGVQVDCKAYAGLYFASRVLRRSGSRSVPKK